MVSGSNFAAILGAEYRASSYMLGPSRCEFIFDNDDKWRHKKIINFNMKVDRVAPPFMREYRNAYSAPHSLIFGKFSIYDLICSIAFIHLQNANSYKMGGRTSGITYSDLEFTLPIRSGRYGNSL